MSSDALEQALALLAAPARRQALRGRPLPDNIGLAIQLAAAPQPLLNDTAGRLSEPADRLLEAVRFYLQQVLFEDRHDAYRTLGVDHSTAPAAIRDHYHWLQRWLHPDRQQGDWGSAYAERVNWAWTQLRSDAARAAYDARDSAAIERPQAPFASPPPAWVALPPAAPSPHKRPGRPLVGAFAGLAVCAVAVIAASALLTRNKPTASNATAAMPTPAVTVARPTAITPTEPHARKRVAAKEPPRPTAVVAQTGVQATQRKPPAPPRVASIVSTARPAKREVLVPAPPPVHAATRAVAEVTAPATLPAQLPIVEPIHVATRITPPPPRASLTVAPTTTKVSLATPIPQAQVAASSAPSASGAELVDRFNHARIRLADIVAYLRNTAATTPTWVDGTAAPALLDARNDLWRRGGAATAASFTFTPPDWQFTAQATTLRTHYRIDTPDGAGDSGYLSIDMVWQHHGWRVTRMRMGSAP